MIRFFLGIKDVFVSTVTDNASNMLEFCDLYGESDHSGENYLGRVPCLLHSTNLMNECIINGKKGDSLKRTKNITNYVESQKTLNTALSCQVNPDNEEGRAIFDSIFTKFLIDQHGKQKSDTFTLIKEETGNDILRKINELASEINMSTEKSSYFAKMCAENELEYAGKPYRLKTFCITRWVSGVDAMRRFLKLRPVVERLSVHDSFETKFTLNK